MTEKQYYGREDQTKIMDLHFEPVAQCLSEGCGWTVS